MNGLPDSVGILKGSQNPEELEKAAESLAASFNNDDLIYLGSSLRDSYFLRRLDPSKGQGIEIDRFRRVMLALGGNPHPYSTRILQTLAGDDHIRSEPDRVAVLLEAVATLRPLPAERVPLLRAFGGDYFLLNFKLLVDNGSPTALAELEQEILGKPPGVEDESVVSLMHRTFVPHRTDEPLIRMAEDLAQRNISPTLRTGLFESFFDYQGRQWYGPVKMPPEPAELKGAPETSLQALLRLADVASRSAIPAELHRKVAETAEAIRRSR
jgi:hypothetical protein